MLERTDAITNEVLEPITFVLAYPTVFVTSYLLHVSVFVTPSSRRPLRYLLKNCMFFAMVLHLSWFRIESIPYFFFKFTILVTVRII